MIYEIDKADPRLLIIRYNNKIAMNNELCKISERYQRRKLQLKDIIFLLLLLIKEIASMILLKRII